MGFSNIRIVLLQTSHPGNIGSAARAMKTMGLHELYLVNPKRFPDDAALMMAAGADDILEQAKVVNSLDDAIADCHLIIGTSARSRSLPCPLLNPHQTAEIILAESQQHQVALLFGREDKGLSNEELQRCHYHVQIDANPDYSSLNLAAAVQVLCYEIRATSLLGAKSTDIYEEDLDLPNNLAMENYYEHLEKVLLQISFIDTKTPNRIMPRLRRLYNRARPNKTELNILRGILTEISKKV